MIVVADYDNTTGDGASRISMAASESRQRRQSVDPQFQRHFPVRPPRSRRRRHLPVLFASLSKSTSSTIALTQADEANTNGAKKFVRFIRMR